MNNNAIGAVALGIIPLVIIALVGVAIAAVVTLNFGFSMIIGFALMAIAIYIGRTNIFNYKNYAFWLFIGGLIIVLLAGFDVVSFQTTGGWH